MSIADKPLDKVEEADLSALISDKESEGKTIEYKRDPVGTSDGDKREFLADVSSFANTLGGHLIFGIEESGGLPTKLVGLPSINSDQEILRLEEMIRDGIRPPVIGLRTQPVPLANKNVALVMRIPKSWNPPHQVTFQKAFRFYARASNGKYQLDVDELRSIYSLAPDVAQRLRLFRIERIGKIVADDAPVQLEPGAKIVVHLLPISSFAADQRVDLKALSRDANKLNALIEFLRSGGSPRFNLDGLFLAHGTPAPRYAQVFYLEAFDGSTKSEAKPLLDTIWNAAGSPDCPLY